MVGNTLFFDDEFHFSPALVPAIQQSLLTHELRVPVAARQRGGAQLRQSPIPLEGARLDEGEAALARRRERDE